MEPISQYRDLLQALNTIGMMVLGLVVWLRKPGEDAANAVDVLRAEVHGRIQVCDSQIVTLTERIQHMPTSEELAQLEGTVKGIAAKLEGVAAGMTTQNASLGRIEGYLLNSKK